MKKNPDSETGPVYSVVSIEAALVDGDALADWARDSFGVEPVRLEKPGETRTWLDLYFTDDVRALLAARAAERHPAVRGAAVRLCRPRDWQHFWRHHFPVRRIGAHLRIVPVWERPSIRPLRGVRDLWINPGLSFGTGTHFTTQFCLERIEALCSKTPPASMLDAGTGSGILAIAAAKLGARHILATDFDAQALDQARVNLRLNAVTRHIRLAVADLTKEAPPGRYDLVCANLYGHLLIQCAVPLARATAGRLVLSGIREIEGDAVAEAFLLLGLREEIRDGDGEWCGLQFSITPR